MSTGRSAKGRAASCQSARPANRRRFPPCRRPAVWLNSAWRRAARERVPVIPRAGFRQHPREAIELASTQRGRSRRRARGHPPLITTSRGRRGLYAHFRAVAEAIGVPVIIYKHPAALGRRHGRGDDGRALPRLPNVVGVKDATANLARVSLQRHAMGPRTSSRFPARSRPRWEPGRMAGIATCPSARQRGAKALLGFQEACSTEVTAPHSSTRTG